MSSTLDLAIDLIARPSLTPADAGCQDVLIRRLESIGFQVERLRYADVDNFWARRGSAGPLLAFAGHTDVVPTGPLEQWHSPPFQPEVRDGYLYGRGAADMKGSLAAMVTACEDFVARHPNHHGSIGFLVTSDEEGPGVNGTVKVVEHLQARGDRIDWCVIGEPTANERVGDVIKPGRRGSLSARLLVRGTQGHVAYPHLADNPVHRCAPALADLCAQEWDRGNEYFPPTTFQISNVHAGTGATNVIPGDLEIQFNFRYSTESSHEQLQRRVTEVLDRYGLRYDIEWTHSGAPFLTERGVLTDAVAEVIHATTGIETELSTSGGTSDGRFIAPLGTQVVELGPVNASIHKIDERVGVEELDTLAHLYQRILERLLADDRT